MDWCYVSIIGCIVAAYILRQLVTRNFLLNAYHLALFDEFIGNVVSTVFLLELGILADEYGAFSIVFAVSFTLHFYLRYLFFLNVDAFETPFYFIDDYFDKQQMHSVISMMTVTLTQVIAIVSGACLTKLIWTFEDDLHVHTVQHVCQATIPETYSWHYATAVEAVGLFTGTIIDFVTPFVYKPIVRALVTLGLFLTIGHVSGLWMHPVFASALTFRCKGHRSDMEHVMAFWLGPLFGFVLAWQFRLLVRKYVKSISTDEKIK